MDIPGEIEKIVLYGKIGCACRVSSNGSDKHNFPVITTEMVIDNTIN